MTAVCQECRSERSFFAQEQIHEICILMQFLMGTNLLTGHTDKHWKAVRKGVAPAFSAQHMRYGLVLAPALLLPCYASCPFVCCGWCFAVQTLSGAGVSSFSCQLQVCTAVCG